jgi:hypothetical protein
MNPVWLWLAPRTDSFETLSKEGFPAKGASFLSQPWEKSVVNNFSQPRHKTDTVLSSSCNIICLLTPIYTSKPSNVMKTILSYEGWGFAGSLGLLMVIMFALSLFGERKRRQRKAQRERIRTREEFWGYE